MKAIASISALAAIVAAVWAVFANPKTMGLAPPKKGQPDVVLGVIVVVLSIAFLLATLLIPAREGAAPSSKIYLCWFALMGLVWGLSLLGIKASARRRHHD